MSNNTLISFDSSNNAVVNTVVDGQAVKAGRVEKRKNVEFDIANDVLTIKVKLNKVTDLRDSDLSASGKSYTIATTAGFIQLPSNFKHCKLSLNVISDKKLTEKIKEKAEFQKAIDEAQKAVSHKDTQIAMLEAEIMEMKALMQKVLSNK